VITSGSGTTNYPSNPEVPTKVIDKQYRKQYPKERSKSNTQKKTSEAQERHSALGKGFVIEI